MLNKVMDLWTGEVREAVVDKSVGFLMDRAKYWISSEITG